MGWAAFHLVCTLWNRAVLLYGSSGRLANHNQRNVFFLERYTILYISESFNVSMFFLVCVVLPYTDINSTTHLCRGRGHLDLSRCLFAAPKFATSTLMTASLKVVTIECIEHDVTCLNERGFIKTMNLLLTNCSQSTLLAMICRLSLLVLNTS